MRGYTEKQFSQVWQALGIRLPEQPARPEEPEEPEEPITLTDYLLDPETEIFE